MARSIVAVVVGFLVIGLLAFGTGMAVHAAFPNLVDANGATSSTAVCVATLLYVGVYATFGCWLAARLAPSHPMRHALILGVLGLLFNIMGAWMSWGTVPAWYTVAGVLTTMLWAWLGGAIRERQLAAPRTPAMAAA